MATTKNKPVYQFKITLLGISPPIWRRIQVPGTYTCWDLHVAIQDAMGWLDYHLHAFDPPQPKGQRRIEIGIPDDESSRSSTIPGWEVGIADHFHPGVVMPYRYDFGDDWIHEVLLESVTAAQPGWKYPRCIAGERACPPEDCGGIPGYLHLMDVLRDPDHPDRDDHISWLRGHAKNYHPYDPERFDPQGVRFGNPRRRWVKAFGQKDR